MRPSRFAHESRSYEGASRTWSFCIRCPIRGSASCLLPCARRYGLKPFRERGRRSSTVQVRAPETFQHQTLWPEFVALSEELHTHLSELTERVIREAIHADVSEAAEGQETKALPQGGSSA